MEPDQSETPLVPPASKRREARFPDTIILLLVFLGSQVVLGLVVGVAAGATGGTIGSLILAGIEAASMAMLIPVIRARLGHRLRDYVTYRPVHPGVWAAVVICCAGLILGLRQLEALVLRLLPITQFWRAAFSQIAGGEDLARGLVLAAIIAPVVEEVLFRGIVLRGFAASYGKALGLLYSSLLFGLVHLNPWQFVPAVVLGLFLGALYLRSGTVVMPIAAHALYNGTLVVLSRFSPTRAFVDAEVSAGIASRTLTALTLAGIAVFCFGFWLLIRSTKPGAAEGSGSS
jgi:hypothetical protein